jgi:hypothetical protein
MTNSPERPNTVAGLEAKRQELHRLRDLLEAEVRKVTCDLDHLDAAIALFDPANTPAAVQRYVVKHRAKKGDVRKFVLAALRDAVAPVTSATLTDAWLEARSLRADEQTRVVIRKRIGACLTSLRNQGLATAADIGSGLKAWTAARPPPSPA